MGKTSVMRRLLMVFFLVVLGMPGLHAARLYGGTYARIGVPDLVQAEGFFRDVLDCRLIGPDAGSGLATVLLSCDEDSVVELFQQTGSSQQPAPPLRFIVSDVARAGAWLRHAGASHVGNPRRMTSGPLAGRMVVDFATPWGQPLQLLGHGTSRSSGTELATADGG